jgi:hypothetical protein
MRRTLVAGAVVTLMVVFASPATATIHPIVQSIACAAAAARENISVADPPGQTPEGFVGDSTSVSGTTLTVSFPSPLTFDNSDFRALIATGFVDQIVTNADGEVTSLLVDLTSLPKALSGSGGAHCANAA